VTYIHKFFIPKTLFQNAPFPGISGVYIGMKNDKISKILKHVKNKILVNTKCVFHNFRKKFPRQPPRGVPNPSRAQKGGFYNHRAPRISYGQLVFLKKIKSMVPVHTMMVNFPIPATSQGYLYCKHVSKE